MQASSVGNSYADYVFTLSTTYSITSVDRILIEYNGPDGIYIDIWNVEKFDGANTRVVLFNNGYTFASTQDMVGFMSS